MTEHLPFKHTYLIGKIKQHHNYYYMKQFFKKLYRTDHQGFVLLFSVVVSAVIFFIGAGIFTISFKELLISSLGKESQKSIFAADAGVECGLQLDTDGYFIDNTAYSEVFNCFGSVIANKYDNGINEFYFTLIYPDKTCAKVTTIKPYDGGPVLTTIYAQGYNKCNNDGPVNFPGLAERVYKVSF